MRTIKFRAWDEKHKDMSIYEPVRFEEENMWTWDDVNPVQDNWLMQYTGLNDNNGTEIYEGDIMFSEFSGRGVVQWNNDNSCFEVYVPSNAEDDRYFYVLSYGNVVGNIHENPELL